MAKNRMVDTVFWEDNYTANLDPIEKLLFLYFLTNPSTNICGIYQITLRKVAVETGIDKEMVGKVLQRFERDSKIYYRDGWVGLRNFIKHQNQNSPQVKKGIERELNTVPEDIKSLVFVEGMYTLSHLTKPNLTKPNLTLGVRKRTQDASKTKKVKKTPEFTTLGAEVVKAFEDVDPKNKTYYANKTQRAAADFLVNEYGLDKVIKVIALLSKTNSISYFPSITSPNDLKERWVKLEGAMLRKKGESIKNGRGVEL